MKMRKDKLSGPAEQTPKSSVSRNQEKKLVPHTSSESPEITIPEPIPLSSIDRALLRILLLFCNDHDRRTEAEIDAEAASTAIDHQDIKRIELYFGSDFVSRGLHVLEVGCGTGDLAVALAEKGANVTGIEIDGARVRQAEDKIRGMQSTVSIRFIHANFLSYKTDERFDRIISLEAFEHITHPHRFLPKMAELLSPAGKILSFFGPTWRSPYGAHMRGLTKLPWFHLYLPERVVLSARREMSRPTDPATRYEDIRGGLNKMTVKQFRSYAQKAGLRFERFEINPQFRSPLLRGLNKGLTSLPGLRELFAHSVLCILSRRDRPMATRTEASASRAD
jgi:ubiquinone/menaquinone biosynthesis C-methylase UbiE